MSHVVVLSSHEGKGLCPLDIIITIYVFYIHYKVMEPCPTKSSS